MDDLDFELDDCSINDLINEPNDDPEDALYRELDHDIFDTIIEMLKHMHKREDPTPLRDELEFRFGSANAMLAADRYIWEQLGLRRNDAILMSHLTDVSRRADQSRYGRRPRLNTPQQVLNYLISNFYGLQTERTLLLCLNRQGYLKERVFLYEGTEDCTLVNLRKLLRETVRIGPTAVILSHNHPGGNLIPSKDDIDSTVDVMQALSTIGIPMLDHLIIAGDRGVSLRMGGYIPEAQWLEQLPGSRMLARWPDLLDD